MARIYKISKRDSGKWLPSFQEPEDKSSSNATNMERFRCYRCDLSFRYSFALQKHLEQHVRDDEERKKNPVLSLPCETCFKKFSSVAELTKHQEMCAGEGPSGYKEVAEHSRKSDCGNSVVYYLEECEICYKRFKHSRALRKHLMKRHIKKCSVSLIKMNVEPYLRKPIKAESSKTKAKALLQEIPKKHVKPETDKSDQIKETTPRRAKSKLKENLQEELVDIMNEEESEEESPIKPQNVSTKEKDLTLTKGEETPPQRNESGLYECSECEKKFTFPFTLKKHMAQHRGDVSKVQEDVELDGQEEEYKCVLCNLTFKTAESLQRHIDIHDIFDVFANKDKSKSKEEEEEDDAEEETEKEVEANSDDDNPFLCSLCDKSFRNPYQLKTHTYNDHEKPMSCPRCNESVIGSLDYSNHLNSCKPFKCQHCEKSFNSQRYLDSHLDTIHPSKRPNGCYVCRKAFDNVEQLKRHIESHFDETDKASHTCQVCDKPFSSMDELSRHVSEENHQLKTEQEKKTNKRGRPKKGKNIPDVTKKVPDIKKTDIKKKLQICPRCNNSIIGTAREYTVHTDTCMPFKCEKCPRTFKAKSALNMHVNYKHTPPRETSMINLVNSIENVAESRDIRYDARNTSTNEPMEEEKLKSKIKTGKPSEFPLSFDQSSKSSGPTQGEKNTCWCGKGYIKKMGSMICCDWCDFWYHGKCVSLTKEEIKRLSRAVEECWICPKCSNEMKRDDRMDFQDDADVVVQKQPNSAEKIDNPSTLVELMPTPELHSPKKDLYHCQVCNKGFDSSKGLIIHLAIHMEEQKYPCIYCPIVFNDLFLATSHYESNHQGNNYQRSWLCDYCGINFKNYHQLSIHSNICNPPDQSNIQDCEISTSDQHSSQLSTFAIESGQRI